MCSWQWRKIIGKSLGFRVEKNERPVIMKSLTHRFFVIPLLVSFSHWFCKAQCNEAIFEVSQ